MVIPWYSASHFPTFSRLSLMSVCCSYRGFSGGSVVKNLPASAGGACGRCRFGPWVRKTPWRKNLQTTPAFLTVDRGAWRATVPGVAKSQDMTEGTERKHSGIYDEENK